jgi:hypothetical protein
VEAMGWGCSSTTTMEVGSCGSSASVETTGGGAEPSGGLMWRWRPDGDRGLRHWAERWCKAASCSSRGLMRRGMWWRCGGSDRKWNVEMMENDKGKEEKEKDCATCALPSYVCRFAMSTTNKR